MDEPLLSLVIPSFNRLDTLRHVLPSLLEQSADPKSYEIILSDSCSNDGTRELVESFADRVRYLRRENRGRADARNHGIREAQGSIVLFTDSDIIADRDLVKNHLRVHRQHPGGAVVGCEVQVDTFDEYREALARPELRRTLHNNARHTLPWLYFLTGNASAPREALIQVGMFDESFVGYGHEDLELGYRLEKAGLTIRYAHDAVNYHLHPVPFDQRCRKMYFSGIATVRFHHKHQDPRIALLLGMTPLSLGLHSLLSPRGRIMRHAESRVRDSHFFRELVLQYHYLNGVKAARRLGADEAARLAPAVDGPS